MSSDGAKVYIRICYKLVYSSDRAAIHGYSLRDIPCSITNSFNTAVTVHRLLIYNLGNDLPINSQPGGPPGPLSCTSKTRCNNCPFMIALRLISSIQHFSEAVQLEQHCHAICGTWELLLNTRGLSICSHFHCHLSYLNTLHHTTLPSFQGSFLLHPSQPNETSVIISYRPHYSYYSESHY